MHVMRWGDEGDEGDEGWIKHFLYSSERFQGFQCDYRDLIS